MLLYLDTCIVIYLVEEHHVYSPVIEAALADTTADLCFSPLVELECLVLPLKHSHTLLLDKYRRFFAVNKRLGIPHEVFLEAAALRARHGLRTPDALHMATALHMAAISCGRMMIGSRRYPGAW
jgi:uncharacterized protein